MDGFFLALAHQKLGQKELAQKDYRQAVQWLASFAPYLKMDPQCHEELRRFQEEAAEALGLKEEAPGNSKEPRKGP